MGNNKEITYLCEGCKWGAAHTVTDQCGCPDLSLSIWDYITPDMEQRVMDVSEVFKVCNRERLQNKTATAYVCPVIARMSGECKHYMPCEGEK